MANLDEVFTELNFTCQKYRNLNYDLFKMILTTIAETNYANVDSFACVILSHGKDNLITTGDNQKFKLDSLYELLLGNKSLENKPKLIFVNSFRNKDYISQTEHDDFLKRNECSDDDELDDSQIVRSRIMPNTLKFYFVAYGMRAYANEEARGSLIITILNKNLKENGKTKSFLNNINLIVADLEESRIMNKKVQFELELVKLKDDFIFT